MKIFQPIISGSIIIGDNSLNIHQFTGSVSFNNGLTGSLLGTASYAENSSNSTTSSYALDSDKLDGLNSTEFAILTASNIFTANQIITGSLNVSQGITGSLFGTSSYSSQSLSSSYASYAELLNNFSSSDFVKLNYDNTFSGNQTINGNVTIHGTASVNILITTYESSSIIYTSGSTRFGNSFDDTHEFIGSINSVNGVTGSLLGTASYASNANLLDGLDSTNFSPTSRISISLDGVVSGSNPTSIGTFYVPLNSTYSVSSFVYFGGSQGDEEANIEFRLYSSPISLHTITKNTTLSISYLTSSLSLTAGLYNLYLYSSGSGSAIAKSLYLTS